MCGPNGLLPFVQETGVGPGKGVRRFELDGRTRNVDGVWPPLVPLRSPLDVLTWAGYSSPYGQCNLPDALGRSVCAGPFDSAPLWRVLCAAEMGTYTAAERDRVGCAASKLRAAYEGLAAGHGLVGRELQLPATEDCRMLLLMLRQRNVTLEDFERWPEDERVLRLYLAFMSEKSRPGGRARGRAG